jgi:hypothetical protein
MPVPPVRYRYIEAFLFTVCVFLIYALFLSVMLVRFGVPTSIPSGDGRQVSFRTVVGIIFQDKALLYFLLAGILTRSAYEQVNTNLSVHFQQHIPHGLRLFALSITVNDVVVVVLQGPLSRWGQHKSLMTNILAGSLCSSPWHVPATGRWPSWVSSFFTVGEILTFPAGTLFIDKIAPEPLRGAYYGTKNILDLGKFFGPWLGSLAMAAWGGTIMLNGAALVVLAVK